MRFSAFSFDTTSFTLCIVLVVLVLVNTSAMWQDYEKAAAIKSDNPSGSTLVERYLILGDWPASKEQDFMGLEGKYPINAKKVSEDIPTNND
ncbi:hypothetical protein ACVBIL_17235 [Shewanella sp. 125m-7]